MDTGLHGPEPADAPGACPDPTAAAPDDQDQPAANGGVAHAPDRTATDRAEPGGG